MDPDTKYGLIYGKIIHNQHFGRSFEVVLQDRKSNSKQSFIVESYGSSPDENIFIELEPGEWHLHAVDKHPRER